MSLTANDLKVLRLIYDKSGLEVTMSSFGFLLYPDGRKTRTAQGMALAGGKMLRRLIRQGLVKKDQAYGSCIISIKITKLGIDALCAVDNNL